MEAMDLAMSNSGAAGSGAASRETVDRIKRVFVSSLHLNLTEADLAYEQQLDELVGLDSLAVIEFVTAIEKEFGIRIEHELLRLDFVRSLPRLSAYVEDRVAQVRRFSA
jgi:acyl carrier protein